MSIQIFLQIFAIQKSYYISNESTFFNQQIENQFILYIYIKKKKIRALYSSKINKQ